MVSVAVVEEFFKYKEGLLNCLVNFIHFINWCSLLDKKYIQIKALILIQCIYLHIVIIQNTCLKCFAMASPASTCEVVFGDFD